MFEDNDPYEEARKLSIEMLCNPRFIPAFKKILRMENISDYQYEKIIKEMGMEELMDVIDIVKNTIENPQPQQHKSKPVVLEIKKYLIKSRVIGDFDFYPN